jgi:hypothetical protein
MGGGTGAFPCKVLSGVCSGVYMQARTLRRWGIGVAAVSAVVILVAVVANFDNLMARITNADELLEQAKKAVPEPELPPKPHGQVVETFEKRVITTTIPCPTFGNPLKICAVKTYTPVKVTKALDPNDQELAAWDKAVLAKRQEYESEVDKEVKRLESEKLEEFRDALEAWVQIVGGIIGAIGGTVALVVALRQERRESLASSAVRIGTVSDGET